MLVAFFAATLLRIALFPLSAGLPFFTYFPILVFVGFCCGVGPGLLFVVMSTIAGNFLFFEPVEHFSLDRASVLACATYAVAGSSILLVIGSYKRTMARQAKQLLRLSVMLSESQKVAHFGSFEFDAKTQSTIWSEEEFRIYGLSPDGPSPKYEDLLSHYIHPEDAESVDRIFSSALANRGVFELEHRIVRPDGTIRWVLDRAHPYFDESGGLLRYVGATLDVTERKNMEMALRDSEEKLRSTFSHAGIGFALARPSGVIVDANPAFCRLSGYSIKELSGLNAEDLIHPDDLGANVRLLESMLAGHIPSYIVENRLFTKDENTVWVRKNVSLVRDAEEEARWIVILVEDVTERRAIEEALRSATAEAERANNAKTRFLAAASHDLRQPLSALNLYANLLDVHVNEEGRQLLENLQECAGSLSELLTDLLDLSKLDAGVVVPHIRDFGLNDILMQAYSVHAPEAELKGLDLRCVPTTFITSTDSVLLRRIIGNLLSNAVRYTEKGRVLIGCRRREGKRWVEVWDTGIGIPPSHIGNIFEEFRQLDNDARNRGSGLGLAIVAKTAQLLGLKIHVQSWPGVGSMFAIEVPKGKVEGVEPATSLHNDNYKQLRVAFVEDNHKVRQALVLGLASAGHTVIAADTGAKLLEQLGDQVPDIVISDYRLDHGETGFDVIEGVRAVFDSAVPALLISGDTDPKLVRAMADRGIFVLHKPIELDTLLAYLEDLTHFPQIAVH